MSKNIIKDPRRIFSSNSSSGGSSGTIQSIVAGTDISIDNTDPANPIVNFNGTYQQPITVVANYSALPAVGTVAGKFYWASASQGTSWLPGSLGGTYYNSGLYYSNGITWEYLNVPYQATQAEVNTGTNTDKFVTPDTLKNSSQWSTKQAIGTYATGTGSANGVNTGDNATNTTSNTYADGKVADIINDGVTTIAPSQNAVFDALALKAPLNSPTLVTPIIDIASGTSLSLSTFLQLSEQAIPSTPTNALRLFADTSNRFSWIGENGFIRTFDGTANTASRMYTLQDKAGTIAHLDDITGSGNIPLSEAISQLNTPPAHVLGERYLINTTPTGAWVGFANNIAESDGVSWTFTAPVLNNTVYLTSTAVTFKYNGTLWVMGGATPILQNGNSLGIPISIGSNDNFNVRLKRNNILAAEITSTGFALRNSANTFQTEFQNAVTANRTITLPNVSTQMVGKAVGASTATHIPYFVNGNEIGGTIDFLRTSEALVQLNSSSSSIINAKTFGLNIGGIGSGVGVSSTNPTTSAIQSFILNETVTKYFAFSRNNSAAVGNYSGTNFAMADSGFIQSGGTTQLPLVMNASVFVNIPGITGTSAATRLDTFGLRIGTLADSGTANTVTFQAGSNLKYVDSTAQQTLSATIAGSVANNVVNLSTGTTAFAESKVSSSTYLTTKRLYSTGFTTSGIIVANLSLDFNTSIAGHLFLNNVTGTYFTWAIGGTLATNEYMRLTEGLLAVKNSAMRMVSTTANNNNVVTNNKILKVDTADGTLTELTTDGLTGSVATNRIAVPLNTSMSIVVNICVKQSGSANSKQMLRQFLITNNAGTTTIEGTVTALGTDVGSAALTTCSTTITANNTDDCIKIEVTGLAATNLRWTAYVVSTEVLYT